MDVSNNPTAIIFINIIINPFKSFSVMSFSCTEEKWGLCVSLITLEISGQEERKDADYYTDCEEVYNHFRHRGKSL